MSGQESQFCKRRHRSPSTWWRLKRTAARVLAIAIGKRSGQGHPRRYRACVGQSPAPRVKLRIMSSMTSHCQSRDRKGAVPLPYGRGSDALIISPIGIMTQRDKLHRRD